MREETKDLNKIKIATFTVRGRKEAELIKFAGGQFADLRKRHLQIPVRLFHR